MRNFWCAKASNGRCRGLSLTQIRANTWKVCVKVAEFVSLTLAESSQTWRAAHRLLWRSILETSWSRCFQTSRGFRKRCASRRATAAWTPVWEGGDKRQVWRARRRAGSTKTNKGSFTQGWPGILRWAPPAPPQTRSGWPAPRRRTGASVGTRGGGGNRKQQNEKENIFKKTIKVRKPDWLVSVFNVFLLHFYHQLSSLPFFLHEFIFKCFCFQIYRFPLSCLWWQKHKGGSPLDPNASSALS